MISLFIDLVIVFVGSILFHELGHVLVLYFYNRRLPNITWEKGCVVIGDDKDYKKLSEDRLALVYFVGIWFGFAYITMYSLDNWYFSFLFVPYLLGCKSDLANLRSLL